ncbi:hypothetical protein B2K_40275 [Paenibacillus mucilaginosus K02]|uniref:Uncharacterized protein n=1 Tax=Paenibacillus mucilaginosus K02 TaxID=997761 RepID=R9ULT5_9BACL|nr:hypothetical protein B2K_40275 [Paenibacillus mucilaginosus K02]
MAKKALNELEIGTVKEQGEEAGMGGARTVKEQE